VIKTARSGKSRFTEILAYHSGTISRTMPKDEVVEVKCPDCGAVVRIAREKADREMKAKCPNGHEVPLVKAL
jgi:predicted RNA-binding Zn-ribbon protein involved in translation (DUF1610 family)